jgi:RNA polymerase sigma-70 factor (ECF subfamily)
LKEEKLYKESEILSLVAVGNEPAFEKLFNHYHHKIYTIAIKLTHSTVLAEEIVQDVFLIIWQRRSELYQIQDFDAYLFIVARNKVYKVLKRIAKNYSITSFKNQSSLAANNDTSDVVMNKEYNFLLKKAIDRLPNQQRQVYKYIKEDGLKRDEVAFLLHLKPETVKSNLAQSMKKIRAYCIFYLSTFSGLIISIYCFLPE